MRRAHVPQGAILIDNPVSAAPGFQIGNVLVLPGVPRIMQAMFDGVRHRLAGGVVILSRTVSCNLAESMVAAGLSGIQDQYPDLEIGSYPFFRAGKFGTSLVLRGPDEARLESAAEAVRGLIRAHGGEPHGEEPA
jgi:molybdopterin-biosynthesis enzyme MoeA-like protein